jgi:hypothetical protein
MPGRRGGRAQNKGSQLAGGVNQPGSDENVAATGSPCRAGSIGVRELGMRVRDVKFTSLLGRRFLTTPGQPAPHVLSLHRIFPYTLYKVNPGERSNIVDLETSPRSKPFYDKDEAQNLVKGRVYPSVTSQRLSLSLLLPSPGADNNK